MKKFASRLIDALVLGRRWRLRWREVSNDAGKVREAEEGR